MAGRARFCRSRVVALAFASACSGAPTARELTGSSSDGVVFARQLGAQSDLFRARIADGAVHPLLETGDRAETWPYWNEAAGRLLFQSEPAPRGGADLLVWRPGDAAPSPLAAAPARDERWAEWSPDGTRVVFAFRGGTPPSGLAWVEVPGDRETLAAASGARDVFFRPSYDPTSRFLVAQRRGATGRGATIWRIDEQGPRRLTTQADWLEDKPSFTRDGAVVLFSRGREGAPRQLARIMPAGDLASLPAALPGADEHSVRGSPTRDEVAFVSDRSGSRDVWLAPLDAGAARNLSATPDRDELAPRWSPDGERLVVTSVPPGPPGRGGEKVDWSATRLVVLDREGRVLLETPGMMADWMPPFEAP